MVTAPAALPCGGNLRLAAGPGPESGPPPSDRAGSTAVDLQLNEARLLYLAFLSASVAFCFAVVFSCTDSPIHACLRVLQR